MRVTKRPLFHWVLYRCRGLQFLLFLLILASLVFRVAPLEMQKRIINRAIHLKSTDLLLLYCAIYLAAVLLAGLSKYAINVMQMIIGQRILMELRTELYHHILRLPLQYYRQMQPGTVISAMTAELNSIGYFLGGALAVPLTSGLTFVVFIGYMFMLSRELALLTLSVYPFEILLIPLLQKRYNRINRERIRSVRAMSNVVNEAIAGIQEVHAHGGYRLEEERIGVHIHRLYDQLKKLFIVKYGIKFTNNLFQSLGPFLLFLVGGYFAITGDFTLGALVAFLSAHEKVYDPWREILDYYQALQDARVRYGQIMRIFDLEPDMSMETGHRPLRRLDGSISVKNGTFRVASGVSLLKRINLEVQPGEQVAVVGFSGSGKSTLILCLDQLYRLSSGTISYGCYTDRSLSRADISANVTLIGQEPFLFTGTIRENLLYGIRALAGERGIPDLETQLKAIYDTGLEEDVIRFGFQAVLGPEDCAPIKDKLLSIRTTIIHQLQDQFAEAVEFYDVERFLLYSSIRDNLIFGDCPTGKFDLQRLPDLPVFRQLIRRTGLEKPLLGLGLRIARQTIELLADVREDEFFFRYTPMRPEEFSAYQGLVQALEEGRAGRMEEKSLLVLALRFIPGFHRVAAVDEEFKERIVRARKIFLREVAGVEMITCLGGGDGPCLTSCAKKDAASPFMPFCTSQYLYSRSLLENLVFGVMKSRKPMDEHLSNLLYGLLAREVLDDVLNIGLDFNVGSRGDRLSGGQKQKLAIARALLRQTPIILMDEATASLDAISQQRIYEVLAARREEGVTVVAVVHRLESVAAFDRVILLKNGAVIEEGTYDELLARQGEFAALVAGHRGKSRFPPGEGPP